MRRLVLGFALTVLSAPVAAEAATAFDSVKASDCTPAGVVSNATLRDQLFEGAGVTFSTELAQIVATNQLGERAREAAANCGPAPACKGLKGKLADLYEKARPLSDQQLLAPDGFTAHLATRGLPPPIDRPKAFLNGDWDWLSVACTVTTATPDAPKPPKPPEQRPKVDQPALVIAKSEDDAGKSFGKRAFAGFGYSDDRLARKSTYDVDLFVGYAMPFRSDLAPIEFQPFLSYQRHTAKDVDDLALGTAFTWFPGNSGHVLRLKAAWESDDRFESSAWRADIAWTPPLFQACERSTVPGKHFASCELSFVADYVDIGDPGRKKSLATLTSFTRLGGDLNLTFGQSLGEDMGFIVFTGAYQTRADVTGRGGNADMATASIGYTPGDKSHFKVSVDYSFGHDLTSLEKQDKVVLTLGVRR